MRSPYRSSVWHAATLAFVVVLLIAIVLAACTSTPPVPPTPGPTPAVELPGATPTAENWWESELPGTSWQLYSYADSQGQTVEVMAGTGVSIAFTADRYAGSAGCNRYSGAYKLNAFAISLQPPSMSERACTEPVMQQEDAYLSALGRAVKAMRTEGSLDMLDAAGKVILSYTMISSLPLVGPTWQVVDYDDGKSGVTSPLPGSAITLTFGSEGQLSGTAGCNTYSASYEVGAAALTIAPPVATRKMCAEPAGVMEQEATYLARLSTTASFAIQGEELALRDAQGATVLDAIVLLDANAPAAPASAAGVAAPLPGKTWQLTSYADAAGQAVTPLPDTPITLAFADGRFAGNAGCNQYNGQYTVSGDQISVELGATTRRACPEAIMQQERAYLTALSQATTYAAPDGRLEILDVNGRTLLSYAPAAVTAAAPPAEEATPPATPQLAGPVWQWLETKGGDGTLLMIQAPERYAIQFMPGGTVTVQADCNTGSGAYAAEASSLKIDINALTKMDCREGSLSDKFVASLNAAATYVIVDGSLYINMQMDAGDMKFVPATAQ